jgi:predicted lactoylglutathione lyase
VEQRLSLVTLAVVDLPHSRAFYARLGWCEAAASNAAIAFFADATRAGGRLVRPASTTSRGGHAGWFADPDGHLWEVAHNPFFPLDAEGRLGLSAP